ncbi:uncharacterized protein KQ657_000751 [Scheffersomyces spartinae]|uniref:CUE domain-containing protein n=1 Tax=Scheffersomyces spartinae TaxID=45513 RepID=A0A9P8AI39_9ASCO|nr:uncharacterized protein KQ657_000751 [Scheffersomyces spartinae]KAG7193335.1 hypothetical protein KQ657_000751 [Scheffersomyces spartinae]
METSTTVFIATLALGFIVLRWLIAPIPPHLPAEVHGSSGSSSTSSSARRTNAGNRRPVTQSMIEVVQTVAPQLTVGQIRMDLERTGSVELTLERFMENGSLPFPAGEDPSTAGVNSDTDSHNRKPGKPSEINLLERYAIDPEDEIDEDDVAAAKDGYSLMAQRKKYMILNARKRMQQQQLLAESI